MSKADNLFDGSARKWEKLGTVLHRRPIQFIMYLLSSVAVIVVLGYSLVTTNANKNDIGAVKAALCNNPNLSDTATVKQCQRLFDRLLNHPTPQQVERLRQLMKGK